tara:strand:+ start:422 stop:775 length:354 start_codon:yes stop_codon:yes gene_type:complete
MAKKQKTGIYIGIGIGVLTLGAIGYFLILKRKRSKVEENINSLEVKELTPEPEIKFPLNIGSKGKEVKIVQSYLNKVGKNPLRIDGIYGKNTANALKKWNKKTEVTKSYFDWIMTQK